MSVLGKAATERRLLTAGLLHDWSNVVALTAIFVLSVLALQLGEESSLHSVVVAVTAAYLVSDALWIMLQPDMVKTPVSIVLHHLVTLIVIVDPLEHASHRVNASRALLVEVNTVLLTLRRLLGHPSWCEIGFYLTWALIRLIWFPALGTALLASTFAWTSPLVALPAPLSSVLVVQVRAPPVRSYASIAFAAVVLLQFYWTLAMGRGLCKSGTSRAQRGKERSADETGPASFRLLALSLLSTTLIAACLLNWMFSSTPSERQVRVDL